MHYPLPPSGHVGQPGSFSELRDELRHRIDRAPLGRITLLARNARQRVHLIRDVSAHGVSLVLEYALEPGEPVLIEQCPEPLALGEMMDRNGGTTTSTNTATSTTTTSPRLPVDEQMPGDCVYRAYVVWCRDCEPGCSAPDAHFIAGLRVYGPQSLERLILPIGAAG